MFTRWQSPAAPVALLLAFGVLAPAAAQQRPRPTTPAPALDRARAQTVPAQTVVRAQLAEDITSRTAMRGDRVMATLAANDRSGFPTGTRFEGVVTDVRKSSAEEPAVLDMEFRRAILPDGTSQRILGELASLSDDDVRTTAEGRTVSRRRSGGNFDWKWVGYGAAGGAVLGQILGGNFLKGALLGGLGGAVYSYLNRGKDRGEFREVEVTRGTEFGIHLAQDVAFNSSGSFRYPTRQQVAGARDEFRMEDATVFVDNEQIRFDGSRPMRVNGVAYLPLRPIAEAAGWTLTHELDADDFEISTPAGRARGTAGELTGSYRNGQSFDLGVAPLRIDEEIYVPVEYFSRVGDLQVDWNRRGRRLNLTRFDDRRRAGDLDEPRRPGDEPRGRVSVEQLVRSLTTIDYETWRDSAGRVRVVDVETMLTPQDVRALRARIDESSVARRNRNLVTQRLRESGTITNIQVVVGLSEDGRTAYVF